jgi:hypothetical protein
MSSFMIIESTVLKPPSSDRETFLDNELEALRFPNAMYRNCTLCERSYTDSNHPVIVKGISGCHCVLGHACLTRHLENSNTCPVQICQKILYRPEGSLRSEEQTCLVIGQCSRILKKISMRLRRVSRHRSMILPMQRTLTIHSRP